MEGFSWIDHRLAALEKALVKVRLHHDPYPLAANCRDQVQREGKKSIVTIFASLFVLFGIFF